MKIISILFATFLLSVVFMANQGTLPDWLVALKSLPGGDKTAHFLLMGSMALLLNITLQHRRVSLWGQPLLLGSLIVLVIVSVEEISQIWLPRRSFDFADLTADYLGILIIGGSVSFYAEFNSYFYQKNKKRIKGKATKKPTSYLTN